MSSALDRFPTEIFHLIFHHLWAHEILNSFGNITIHLNNILSKYDEYKVNFESIRKSSFDLVCDHLKPEQVICLILSDKKETPNQTEFFRSRFSMKQFTRLRALKLMEIVDPEDTLIFDLYQHQHLKSLEIDVDIRMPFLVPMRSLERLIINVPSDIHSNFDPVFPCVCYEQLRQLTLSNCSCEQFRKILGRAVRLQSLKISFVFLDPNDLIILDNIYPNQSIVPPLTSLSLSIKSHAGAITRQHIERFLRPLSRLRKLELIVSFGGEHALLDGYQWEKFIVKQLTQLMTFNFKFLCRHFEENLLDSYRRPFWLDRHWYVACNEGVSFLFTVPHFASTSMTDSSLPIPEYTTLPVEKYSLFYDHIAKVVCESDDYEIPYHYNHVNEFVLRYHSIPKNVLDLSKVQTFAVNSTKWSCSQVVKLIKEHMPSVRSLTLNCQYTTNRYQNSPVVPLEQIHRLQLPLFEEYSIDEHLLDWSGVFPSVEQLQASINSKGQISFLIDQFPTVGNAYFYTNPTNVNRRKSIKITRQWLTKHTHRLRGKNADNFTCQIYNTYACLFTLSLWMGDNNEVKLAEEIPTTARRRWWHRFT